MKPNVDGTHGLHHWVPRGVIRGVRTFTATLPGTIDTLDGRTLSAEELHSDHVGRDGSIVDLSRSRPRCSEWGVALWCF